MHSTYLIVSLFFGCIGFSFETVYYAIRPLQQDKPPVYGIIYAYNSQSTVFQIFANFSFDVNDKDTYLYYFETGPIAVTNNNLSTIYFPIQCGTSYQRLLLISYHMTTKTYKQSSWILNDGVFHFLHYDPLRQRLFGLRDFNTFTMIIEEYDLKTLNVVREYTKQDGEVYAFPYAWCSIFDYEENWIVQVRTRFENPSIQAYFIKMDLNLVGNKSDIVTKFYLLPDIHNLCTMTYDIQTKTALVTWQHGSIDQDLIMMYMNPYTSAFRNETLLLETGSGYVIESIKAVYNEQTNQILFVIDKQSEMNGTDQSWMIIVEFYTMKILDKKQIDSITAVEYWEFFL